MYCVLSFKFTCLFPFHYYGVDAMGGGLKIINQNKIKYDTTLNSCKGPTSLEESWKMAAVIILASDDSGSELINEMMIEMYKSDDGSVKPSSPSGM